MKKMMKLFGLIALSAVAFSCSKEVSQDITAPEGNGPEEQTAPATEKPVADGNVLTSFSVTFENDAAGAKTKVSVDLGSGETDIEEGDLVLVVSGSSSATYQYDGEKFVPETEGGEITIDADAGAGVYYPAGEFELNTTNSQVLFTMPSAIVAGGDFGAINPMAGQITGSEGDYTVQLCNIASVLKVHVDADVSIQSVTLDYGSMVNYAAGSKWFVDAGQKSLARSEGSDDSEETVSVSGTSADVVFILPTVELGELKVTANLASAHNGGSNDFSVSRGGFTPTRNSISTMSFYAGLFSGGAGTSENPYKIANARDFKNMQRYTSDGYRDADGYRAADFLAAHYQQIADIDFKNASLTPIGYFSSTAADANPFKGVYDGAGNTLSKFIVNGTEASTGLFEYVDGATLKNIVIGTCSVTGENVAGILTGRCIGSTTIDGCSHTGGQVTGRNSVGFIAHIYGNTTVKNCTVSNLTVITAASGENAYNQGGVVGFAGGSSSIESCSTSGTILFTGTASGAARGGIVGKLDSTGQVKDCVNNAVVTNALVGSTGGIAGQLTNGTIVSCANTANVSGTSMVGGIVGFAGSTTNDGSATNITFITSCRNVADVTGSANCVGGIAGKLQNGAVMSACYAQGNVKTSTYDVGGLTGFIQINNNNAASRIYFYDCIANMNVTTSRTSGACRTGGAVGYIVTSNTQYVAVDNCGVLDVTITAAGDYVGGFVGRVTGDATNSNRTRIRNCYTLVGLVPGSAKKGGFVGAVENKAELRYDYFVDNDSADISSDAVKNNYAQKTAAEIKSDATCTAFNGNTGFSLTVGSSYTSDLGWALTNGYPVPGALIDLGSEYYK